MSEQQSGKGNLAKALCAVRLATPWWVAKGGFNEHNRYPFVGHAHVMEHPGRRVLSENGLSLVQTGVRYVGELPSQKHSILLWEGTFALLHESGESMTITVQATTQCNDKSAFVASTSLDRTAWLRLLAVAGSEDEDPEYTGYKEQPEQQPQQPELPPFSQAAVDLLSRLESAQNADAAQDVIAEARGLFRSLQSHEQREIFQAIGATKKRHGMQDAPAAEAQS